MTDDEARNERPDVDRSDGSDARRFRWLLKGNGCFLEEAGIGVFDDSLMEQDRARRAIDKQMDHG